VGLTVGILASSVVVAGGLWAVVRAIWRIAQTFRDNTQATKALTDEMRGLSASIDGRFDALADRVTALEARSSISHGQIGNTREWWAAR
jgi:hypothetical protein